MTNCELKVVRFEFTEESTISELYLNGTLFCFCIEDYDRGLDSLMKLEDIKAAKVKDLTAIPIGHYNVTLFTSPKHGPNTPLLHNVPGFDMVEIHNGNYVSNSSACLLVGSGHTKNMVTNSRVTLERLKDELKKYNTITIQISRR